MNVSELAAVVKETSNYMLEVHTLKWDSGRSSDTHESLVLVVKPTRVCDGEAQLAQAWEQSAEALLDYTRATFGDINPDYVDVRLKGEDE